MGEVPRRLRGMWTAARRSFVRGAHTRRAAVVLGGNDFDSVAETLAILGDRELMQEIRAAEAEDVQLYTLDEVTEEMRGAGRLPK